MMNKSNNEFRSHQRPATIIIPELGLRGAHHFCEPELVVSGKAPRDLGFPRSVDSVPRGIKGRAKPGSCQGLPEASQTDRGPIRRGTTSN